MLRQPSSCRGRPRHATTPSGGCVALSSDFRKRTIPALLRQSVCYQGLAYDSVYSFNSINTAGDITLIYLVMLL